MIIKNQNFYGRQDEIHLLFDAWINTLDGKPQWISFVAETGTGKTRLIHEFYRYLSDRDYRLSREADTHGNAAFKADYNPSSYWPRSLPSGSDNLGLNPDPQGLSEAKIEDVKDIPWLWWGLRGNDPVQRNGSENGCAASASLSSLELHTTVLAIQKERFKANLAAVQQIGKWAAPKLPIIGPVCELLLVMGELIQAGKRPFKTLLQGYGIRLREEQSRMQLKLQDLLVNAIFQFLEQDVPVILILDDVHWFDADSVAFLDRLTARLGEQSLKLMIVSTSWAKEWNDSGVRTIFNRFKGTPHEKTLGGIETEHIQSFLLNNFPGLSEEDQALLADRADGNFRYATELVLALRRDPAKFFEDGKLSACLSARGRKEIASRKLKMDELVEERFLAFDTPIQTALMRSSYQGMRFDPQLTSLVTGMLDEENGSGQATLEAIALAERPGAMVCSVEDDLREFLQGPYWPMIRARQEDGEDFPRIQQAYRRIVEGREAELADSVIESLVLQWLERESDMAEKIRLRAWLLVIAARGMRYQAGLHQLTQIALAMADLEGRGQAEQALAMLSPPAAVAALSIFKQYAFGAGDQQHRDALEALCDKLCLILQAPLFLYREKKTLPEGRDLSELVEWCEALVGFRHAMGHIHDHFKWLSLLSELQGAQLEHGAPTRAMRLRHAFTALRLAQERARMAHDRAGWDQVFATFQQAGKQTGFVEGQDQAILWSWVQISILCFGKQGRMHYPETETQDWGDWQQYRRCANNLGRILEDIEEEQGDGEEDALAAFDTLLLEALLRASTLTAEHAQACGYEIATAFLDRLHAVAQAVFERIQQGGHVPTDLACAAIDADLAVANMLGLLSNVTDETVEPALPDLPGVIQLRLAEREVGPSESTHMFRQISAVVKHYRELGMLTMEMIRTFARIYHDRLVSDAAGADEAVQAFRQIVDDAVLTREGERAANGEAVQLLDLLVHIFDTRLAGLPDADALWERLHEAYHVRGDRKFDRLVSMIRASSPAAAAAPPSF